MSHGSWKLAIAMLFAAILGAQAPVTAPKLAASKPVAAKPAAAKPVAAAAETAPKRENGLYARIETSMGKIQLRLFEKESPTTVKNFTDLALGRKVWTDPRTQLPVKKPIYNGLTFHRVIPDFMIQGGDPLGNGAGATKVIADEFDPSLRFDIPGRLAMANSGPNTGSCQFFITEAPTAHLNGLHTIFGQVTEGLDVVKAIARVDKGANDQPVTPVRIVKVSIERVGVAPGAPASPPKPAAPKAAMTAAPRAAAGAKPVVTSKSPAASPAPAQKKK